MHCTIRTRERSVVNSQIYAVYVCKYMFNNSIIIHLINVIIFYFMDFVKKRTFLAFILRIRMSFEILKRSKIQNIFFV